MPVFETAPPSTFAEYEQRYLEAKAKQFGITPAEVAKAGGPELRKLLERAHCEALLSGR